MEYRIIKKLVLWLLISFITLSALTAWLFAAANFGEQLSPLVRLLLTNGVLALILFTLTFFLLVVFVSRPLGRLSVFMRDISTENGDISAKINEKSVRGFQDLFTNYNEFTEKINTAIVRLKDMVDHSTELGESVEGAVKKTSVLNTDVAQAIISNKTMITSLNSEINSSEEGVKGVQKDIQQLTELITVSQAASVNESTAAIEEMIASMGNISRTATDKKRITTELSQMAIAGSINMANTLKAINQVSATSDTVIQMVGIINDVAERINLLAMNAAIEAAHAGAAGKGFSVVASEVKKLAEQTNKNVNEISDSLKAMKKQMAEATSLTRQTDSSINKISQNIKEVTDGISEITDGVVELSAGGDQIMKSMQDLLSITEQVRDASGQTDTRMNDVTTSMETVTSFSNENMKNADIMNILVQEISASVETLQNQGELNAQQLAEIDNELSVFQTKGNDNTFILGFNDVQPFSMSGPDGHAEGAANDFFLAILNEMGVSSIKYKHIQSLERIYEMLDRNTIDAYVLATRTFDVNPSLQYTVPDYPSINPAAGLLLHKDHPLSSITSAADLEGLTIATKMGMPITETLLASSAKIEYLGGEEPLSDCLRMTANNHFDGVYSIICTELEFMANQLGIQNELKTVLLPDPLLDMYTAFSKKAASKYLDDFNRAFKKVSAEKPFEKFLDAYLK